MTIVMTASEAKQGFASVLEAAAREPVLIRRHDRDVAVVLSVESYQRLRGIAVAEFNRVADEAAAKARERGLTEEVLQELLDRED